MTRTLVSKSLKCAACGLVNFAGSEACKRCGAALAEAQAQADAALEPPGPLEFEEGAAAGPPRRGLLKRAAFVFGLSGVLILAWYVSLLETSTAATLEQKQTVRRAVELIEQSGFRREAFLLRRLASFRTSDNWWNRQLRQGDAYAATNFPFEVVTLYPEFFKYPVDDVERAVILLHEARHLAGQNEEQAFAGVWRDKARLGWTRERYGQTQVWKNVSEFTLTYAPKTFRCGLDGKQDCAD
jgi:hypothetical protein